MSDFSRISSGPSSSLRVIAAVRSRQLSQANAGSRDARVESIAVAGLMAAFDEESEVTESTTADCAVSVDAPKQTNAVVATM